MKRKGTRGRGDGRTTPAKPVRGTPPALARQLRRQLRHHYMNRYRVRRG